MPRLRFPFLPLQGGRDRVLRPLLPIEVSRGGSPSFITVVGLLDTGTPFTVFQEDHAAALGIEPEGRLRESIRVGGWEGRPLLVHGLALRLRGPDLDAAGSPALVDVRCQRALLVPPGVLFDFALLGQQGFLDGVAEVRFRQRDGFAEIVTDQAGV